MSGLAPWLAAPVIALAASLCALLSINAIMRRRQAPWSAPLSQDIVLSELVEQLQQDLAAARDWPTVAGAQAVTVAAGMLPGITAKAYRSEVTLAASLEEVVRFIADEMVERLPDWNREFLHGEAIALLHDEPDSKAWLYRVVYRTPFIFRDREYLYYLARKQLDEGSVIVAYQSVGDAIAVTPGCVRGVLFRTVHLCQRLSDRSTRVEHILANDICGGVSQWLQNHVFARGFIAANVRDAANQRAIFANRQRAI